MLLQSETALVGQSGSAAMPYTRLYSVHLYGWKTHQMWPLGSLQARREIHSRFETCEEGHTKSETGAIIGSTNWALVQQKFKKKEKKWNCS